MNSIDKLKSMIKAELDLCDSDATPMVCQMKETDYSKLEQLIIDHVVKEGRTINSAIVKIEREYNDRFVND